MKLSHEAQPVDRFIALQGSARTSDHPRPARLAITWFGDDSGARCFGGIGGAPRSFVTGVPGWRVIALATCDAISHASRELPDWESTDVTSSV
jgi:hypothetical protein